MLKAMNIFARLHMEPKDESKGPTYESELIGKDPEEGLAVQRKHDGEIGAHRAPNEHVVKDRPEACI